MSESWKPDRRITRTKNALWESLQALLQQHGWEDISIRMICQNADVARSSFYAHFDSKVDLLDFGFSQVLENLLQMVADKAACQENFLTTDWLVDHIADHPDFFKKVSRLGSEQLLFSRFSRALSYVLVQEMQQRRIAMDANAVAFAIGGIFSATRRWMDEDSLETKDAFKTFLGHSLQKTLCVNFSN